jgi:hypothetical protein
MLPAYCYWQPLYEDVTKKTKAMLSFELCEWVVQWNYNAIVRYIVFFKHKNVKMESDLRSANRLGTCKDHVELHIEKSNTT